MIQNKQRQVILASLLLTVLALSALFLLPTSKEPVSPQGSNKSTIVRPGLAKSSPLIGPSDQVIEQSVDVISTPSEHDQLVISEALNGTSIDGALRADADGNLILELGIRDFFDYFLSIADDVGAQQAIAEIERYALSYLPEPASLQAVELLGNYLRYKQSEFQIQQTPITQETLSDSDALQLLRTSFDQLKQERQALFSPTEDQALFGLEDTYANHTLSSLELMADQSTTDEQKRERLLALESQLPNDVSASFAETRNNREFQQNIEAEIGSNKDDAEIYETLSSQGIEQQQIDSILARRQQQRQFDSTYQRYQSKKNSLSQAGLEPGTSAYQARINALQNQFFSNPEDRTQAALRDLRQD
jgi:lipase chaperone LimK